MGWKQRGRVGRVRRVDMGLTFAVWTFVGVGPVGVEAGLRRVARSQRFLGGVRVEFLRTRVGAGF